MSTTGRDLDRDDCLCVDLEENFHDDVIETASFVMRNLVTRAVEHMRIDCITDALLATYPQADYPEGPMSVPAGDEFGDLLSFTWSLFGGDRIPWFGGDAARENLIVQGDPWQDFVNAATESPATQFLTETRWRPWVKDISRVLPICL